jgi:hypothetical protein
MSIHAHQTGKEGRHATVDLVVDNAELGLGCLCSSKMDWSGERPVAVQLLLRDHCRIESPLDFAKSLGWRSMIWIDSCIKRLFAA